MKKKSLGGQALIEGVMIKAPDKIGYAARTPEGKIVTKVEKHVSLTKKIKFLNAPFLRGIIHLFEMVVIGTKALTWSANQQGEEEELTKWELVVTFSLAIALTIGLFVLAPYYLAKLFAPPPSLAFNALDGVFRLLFFIGYLWAIGLMKDVKRMFMYHGAEHMSVHCYESKYALNVKNVKKFPPEHQRCGTSLLIYVVAISILLFSFIRSEIWYINVGLRIILIPAVGGISYELLKFAAKFEKNPICKLLSLPGIWTQKLTTRRPTKDQIEVAIAAVKKAK